MAAMYLGPTVITATQLPAIRWMGNAPTMRIAQSKKMDRGRGLDGSVRYNMRAEHPDRWELRFDALRDYQLAQFIGYDEHNGTLQFQNGWEGAAWRTVFIADFQYAPLVKTNLCPDGGYSGVALWSVTMTLEEARQNPFAVIDGGPFTGSPDLILDGGSFLESGTIIIDGGIF